jgi:hypothetical protein
MVLNRQAHGFSYDVAAQNGTGVSTALNAAFGLSLTHVADQLRTKLAKLEVMRERMKKVNSLVRYKNTKALKALGYSEAQIHRLLQPEFVKDGVFFPKYKLRSNYAKIRALKEQVKLLCNRRIEP